MELKPGYKHTEVGIIPRDWEAVRLGAHATFKTGPFGSTLHKADYTYGGVPVINPMQIVDGELLPTPRMAISESAARKLSEFRLEAGNVVLGRRGEMGRCAVVQPEQQGWLCGTGSLIVRVRETLDSSYLQRVLSSRAVVAAIENASVGTTMVNLNHRTLSGLPIPLPSTRAEQEAIAGALSDADALIESLEQLLAKKRQVKQGAMQELLTGKRRLPGFGGHWTLQRLCDFADTDPDTVGADTLPAYTFNYISLEDVDVGTLRSHTEQAFATAPSRARRRLLANDVLVSTVRPNLKSHLHFIEQGDHWVCSTGFCVVRCRQGVAHPRYLFSQLFTDTVARQIDGLLTGSSYPAINSRDVRALKIPIPEYSEQTAIATVLSDMDAEIDVLESRLAKARLIKQGMMQELLTGRIRLV